MTLHSFLFFLLGFGGGIIVGVAFLLAFGWDLIVKFIILIHCDRIIEEQRCGEHRGGILSRLLLSGRGKVD